MHRSKNNTPRGPRQPRTPPPSSPPAFGASKHRGDRTAELLAPQDLATKEVMSSLRSAKQEAFATRSAVDALQLEREQKKQAEAEHMDALAQARAAAFQERKALEKKYKGSDGSTLGFPEATPKAQESALSPKERMAERKRLQQEQHEAQLAQAREEAHQERMQLEAKYGKSPSPNKPAAREPRRPAAIPELDMQQAPREAPPAREARVERVREEPSYAEPRQQEGAATQRPLPQARPAATPPPPPPPPALPRLPEGWASNLDPRTGMVYYSNQADGQVQWHHPGMVGAQQHVMGGVVSAPVESDQPLAYADDIAKLHADQQLEREQQRQAEERRMQHEAEQRRLELETEQRRMQHEAEHQRMQHETERRRIEHESEQRRIDHETEQRRMKYEQQRLQEEESMRQREEAEQQRQEAAQRQAADENRQLAESRLHKSRWQSSIVFGDDSSASSPQAQRATVQAGVPLTPGGSATGYRPGSAMERRMRQNRLG